MRIVALIVGAWGCAVNPLAPRAEVVDVCDRDDPADPADTGIGQTCLPCASDAECVFQGNPCLETVACANVDDWLAFASLGCSAALERRWPSDDECACIDAECHAL